MNAKFEMVDVVFTRYVSTFLVGLSVFVDQVGNWTMLQILVKALVSYNHRLHVWFICNELLKLLVSIVVLFQRPL